MLLLLVFGCTDYAALADKAEVARDCTTRTAYYKDADGDGIGATNDAIVGCDASDGYVTEVGDCDDADATRSSDCPADSGDSGDSGADSGADSGDGAA